MIDMYGRGQICPMHKITQDIGRMQTLSTSWTPLIAIRHGIEQKNGELVRTLGPPLPCLALLISSLLQTRAVGMSAGFLAQWSDIALGLRNLMTEVRLRNSFRGVLLASQKPQVIIKSGASPPLIQMNSLAW